MSYNSKNTIIGREFGDLTVIRATEERRNSQIVYLCKCGCGEEILLTSSNFKYARRMDCGCSKRKKQAERDERKRLAEENRVKNLKVDLVGRQFGKLKVIERCPERYHKQVVYNCQCECKNTVTAYYIQLIKNRKTDCGCVPKKKRGRPYNLEKDIYLNKKFERWTVLDIVEQEGVAPSYLKWLCQCECGTIRLVTGTSIKNGTSKSCGCLATESARRTIQNIKKDITDISGKRFGLLVANKMTDKRIRGGVIWNCHCDCGQDKEIPYANLRNGTKSCGCLKRINQMAGGKVVNE